jgi:DNA replication protein DnaC
MMPSNYNRLANNLEELKLYTFRDLLPQYLTMIDNGQKDITDALFEITEAEKERKMDRVIHSCVKTAGFPFLKELSDFDFTFQPGADKGKILELGTLQFLEAHENIIFIGTPGTGKTHLSVALGIAAAKSHYSTYFINCQELIEQLKRAAHENRLETKLKHYSKYKLLIIDEIGYLNLDESAGNLMFQLISRRYEKKSTIITSNISFEDWGSLFGSSVIANAILDRLLHHCHVLTINGPSYRTKDILPQHKEGRPPRRAKGAGYSSEVLIE